MLARLRTFIIAAAGNDTPMAEDSWIDADINLTPRELLLRRLSQILEVGAGVHAALLLLILIIVILASDSIPAIGGILLASYPGAADTAILLGLVGIAANTGGLLLLAVGVVAQEFWMWIVLAVLILANLAALLIGGFFPALVFFIPAGYLLILALRDPRAFHANPVSSKELRGRMRGVRAFAIITIFLTMMGSFTLLLYLVQLPGVLGSVTIETGQLGRTLFTGVVGVELALIVFIVPALTAGAITGERERRTFDLLQTTLLSSSTFLVGKLESAIGYILLLLLSAIPLQSIAFLFGGISEIEVLLALLILFMTALALGALGLFFSAWTERTMTATVRVYTIALVFVVGLPALHVFFGQPYGRVLEGFTVGGTSSFAETISIYVDMIIVSLNPLTASFYSQRMFVDYQQVITIDVLLQDNSSIPILAPWLLLIVNYLIITGTLILLAIRRMRRGGGS